MRQHFNVFISPRALINLQEIKMEDQLVFELNLSLEEIALRRVIINLWNEADVLPSVQELRFLYLSVYEDEAEWTAIARNEMTPREKWREAVERVKANVTRLVLPESLKNRMMQIVKPIGLEMLRRIIVFYEKNLSDSWEESNTQLQQLCWTSAGTVDLRKTAEKLVRLQTIDILKRYKMASLYCLEDYIPILWVKLPEEYKKRFDELDQYLLLNNELSELEFYWTYVQKGEVAQLNRSFLRRLFGQSTIDGYIFKHSARAGIKAAVEYFFQKLNDEERDAALYEAAQGVLSCYNSREFSPYFSNEKLSDVLCYLLKLMSPDQQMQVLKESPGNVLMWLMEWPRQDCLLDVADRVWTFLPESSYFFYVIDILRQKIRDLGYYFPKLLQEFFLRSPSECKKLFASQLAPFLLSEFSYVEDTETIEILFTNTDIGNGKILASSCWFLDFLIDLIRGEK